MLNIRGPKKIFFLKFLLLLYNSQSLVRKQSLAVARYLLTEDLEQFKKGCYCCSSVLLDEKMRHPRSLRGGGGARVLMVAAFLHWEPPPQLQSDNCPLDSR